MEITSCYDLGGNRALRNSKATANRRTIVSRFPTAGGTFMENKDHSNNSGSGSVSRREFVTSTAAAALGFTIVPRHVLGGPGHVPPSDKVNIAFIGVGAQGLRVMLHFLHEADVQGVAVCDANKSAANHPQWAPHEFCNSVRQLLGVTSG